MYRTIGLDKKTDLNLMIPYWKTLELDHSFALLVKILYISLLNPNPCKFGVCKFSSFLFISHKKRNGIILFHLLLQPEIQIFCCRYWVTEMHVDGFRFDLASIMTRGCRLASSLCFSIPFYISSHVFKLSFEAYVIQ